MSAILTLCGGFLLAVIWMDLMFDVQVLRTTGSPRELPEDVLCSIAAYYRRVVTDARPMSYMVGVTMSVTVGVLGVRIIWGHESRWSDLTSLALCGVPIVLALLRVLPNAARLGSRVDSPVQQSTLARGICRDHLFCLAAIGAFVALQLYAALG